MFIEYDNVQQKILESEKYYSAAGYEEMKSPRQVIATDMKNK